MATTKTYRGIPARLALEYLVTLGGERVDDGDVEDGGEVEGDGWRATVRTEEPESIGPTLSLTPVSVRFEGDEDALAELIPKFAQKAMRAGG